jgi:2,3-bisphosphoglycerate-independent phosphoglycerate mutase
MDRDNRWERVSLAYAAIAEGEGKPAPDAARAIAEAYECGLTDEFVEPAVIGDYRGMADGDGLLMANFRADRAREILTAFLEPDFKGFPRTRTVAFAAAAGMVEYSEQLNDRLTTLFSAVEVTGTLGETVAQNGLRQLRIAETEKYAHVTFFLNGGREATYDGEERILVPSPKVATYDLKPEMSAVEVTDRLVDAIERGRFDLIVCNYANGDMVGHSGKLSAAVKAVETLDMCLGRLKCTVEKAGGCLLITADHGNCEEMVDPVSGQPHTAHSMNRVPFVLVGAPGGVEGLDDGRLADISPTVLDLMRLPRPEAMTGRSLLRRDAGKAAAQ